MDGFPAGADDSAMTFRLRRGIPRDLRSGRRAALLDALLDSVEVALLAYDRDGTLTHANRRAHELTGRCPEGLRVEAMARAFDVRTPDGRPLALSELPVIRALNGETVRGYDVLATTAKGERVMRVNASPFGDDEGIDAGAVAVFEDVTEERRRDARMREELGNLGFALDVHEAIESGRLLMHAQPIVDVNTGARELAELLLRTRKAGGTTGAPGEFLAAAERHGTIATVDAWVFEQAAQLAAHGRAVSINVSAQTAGNCSFLETVETALAHHGADPTLITFEITETAVVSDIVQATRFATRLSSLGCRFALDDFGTGYAALTYLKHLPLDFLKIDAEFVRDVRRDERSRGVVAGIVAMASRFGLRTIAEGVEDAETLEAVRELGVDLAQGFHLGRPAPISLPSVG